MISEFLSVLEEILKYVKHKNKVLYIMGDFNFNLPDPDDNTKAFTDLIFSHKNIALINKPTRIYKAITLSTIHGQIT